MKSWKEEQKGVKKTNHQPSSISQLEELCEDYNLRCFTSKKPDFYGIATCKVVLSNNNSFTVYFVNDKFNSLSYMESNNEVLTVDGDEIMFIEKDNGFNIIVKKRHEKIAFMYVR